MVSAVWKQKECEWKTDFTDKLVISYADSIAKRIRTMLKHYRRARDKKPVPPGWFSKMV